MNEQVSLAQSQEVKPSLWGLIWTFNQIALASFGGGLSAWSREVIVVERQWMGEEEFLSASTMCRILPGANQVNLAVFVGSKFQGIPGAVAAVFGLTLIPVLIVLGLAVLYFQFHHLPALQKILHGAAAAAVALTLAMVVKTGKKCLHAPIPIMFFLATFILNGVLRWPLLLVLAIVGPLSLLWAWPRPGIK
jgi:chromate transporter